MATVNLTVRQVIDFSSARLNDASQQLYSDAVQLPFVNIALAELQEIYEANNIPVTDETSAIMEVDSAVSGIVEIPFDDGLVTPPYLPDNLIEVKLLWESPRGLNQWTRVTKVDTLPQWEIGSQVSNFGIYQWATNCIKVLAANANNDLKADYVRSLFVEITDVTDDLLVQNSLSYLGNRVASLVASDIEENQERANRLYGDALSGLDRALTIPTKGRQRITTRRRPFRAGFKSNRQMY